MRPFCCISTQKNFEFVCVSTLFRRKTHSFPKRILTKPSRPFWGLKRSALPPVQKPAHVQASTRRPQERLRWTPSGRPQIRQVGPAVSQSETAAGPTVSESETAGFTAGTKPAHVQASTRRPQKRLRWTPSGRLGNLAVYRRVKRFLQNFEMSEMRSFCCISTQKNVEFVYVSTLF